MSIELYKNVMTIKESPQKKIYLVQSEIDALFYIKRVLDYYDINVYLQLKELKLPHVPKIIEIHEENQQCIVIEEYINCPTLESSILNHEINQKKAFQIMQQLCDTLQVLHEHFIVHRDIKPDNIFYDGVNTYLFDFDISRIHQKDQIKDTRLLGSYGYAAPEQFGFAQSDARTDIYALGVLWNMMLTGQFPQNQLFQGLETGIIQKAIQIDPLQRYQSIEEMKKDFTKKPLTTTSWALPGFRGQNLKTKVIATGGYLFFMFMVFSITFTGVKPWSLSDILNRMMFFGMISIIIIYSSNYRNVWSDCVLQNSEYTLVRIVGRVIVCILIVLAWILLIAIIISILKLS